ncbi:hypothetical protein F4780DRAFT_717875 [Xylariomycetidae sp. FL0641]|nr:hypothetical protein F4780DRAFT_717875 [Xylariomycetidae sp. FL0641]
MRLSMRPCMAKALRIVSVHTELSTLLSINLTCALRASLALSPISHSIPSPCQVTQPTQSFILHLQHHASQHSLTVIMPVKKNATLDDLMYRGFHRGLHWETQGSVDVGRRPGTLERRYRYLLMHPHSRHFAKVITHRLGVSHKGVVSTALAQLYKVATENVLWCGRMEPVEFFEWVKDYMEWSSYFTKEEFWAFTYKLFHARALHLNLALRPGQQRPAPNHPLVRAIDDFKQKFFDTYNPEYTENLGPRPKQDDIERIEDVRCEARRAIDQYFPRALTHAEGEGDGTDKRVARVLEHHEWPPLRGWDLDEEEEEESLGFYYDFGPRYRDRFQERADAEDDEEEGDKKKMKENEGANDDDDGDIVMGGGAADAMDIDMGGLRM